jgi:hypothetical protein
MRERRNAPKSRTGPALRKTAIGALSRRTKEACVFKRILETLPAVCLAMSMALAAESPFIGEWKLDPSKSRMPDEMKVQSKGANKYAFDFGGGAETIVVDGSDQPGHGGTLLSVMAETPDTWIVERKCGYDGYSGGWMLGGKERVRIFFELPLLADFGASENGPNELAGRRSVDDGLPVCGSERRQTVCSMYNATTGFC